MNILVTGATGFTGKALVKRLLDDGHAVTALDYKEGHRTEQIRDWGAKVVIGSVVDEDIVNECVRGTDVVQHLAAAFRELDVTNDYYYDINVNGTKTVLEAAHRHGVKKFVYCSTCGVHGNIDDPPGDEESPIQPADYYQQTKYQAEPIVLEYVEKGLNATILRPAAIFGPGDPERFFMIFKRVAKGRFPMFGSGKTLYHPLYIDNLVDALVLAQAQDKGVGEAYLIADREYVSIEDLVKRTAAAMGVNLKLMRFPVTPLVAAGHICEKVCKPFGVTPPIFPRRVDWYRQNRAFKISKAERDLGYEAKVELNEGLRRTFEWYKEEGML